jgi:hypothetical protein
MPELLSLFGGHTWDTPPGVFQSSPAHRVSFGGLRRAVVRATSMEKADNTKDAPIGQPGNMVATKWGEDEAAKTVCLFTLRTALPSPVVEGGTGRSH